MIALEWRDELSVGVSALVEDHKHLLSLINELGQAVAARRGGDCVADITARLLQHVAEHFEREEAILRTAGYPGTRHHTEEHQRTTAKLKDLSVLAQQKNDVAAKTVLDFMSAWFLNHVVASDLKMRDFLRAKGVADTDNRPRPGVMERIAAKTDVLTIKTRIIMLTILPIIVIVALVAFDLIQSLGKIDRQKDLLQLTEFSATSSALIHSLQKERGASSLFLGSKGTRFAAEVAAQRKETDQALSAFQAGAQVLVASLGQEDATRVTMTLAELKNLDETRKGVDAQSLPVPQVIAYYTGTIAKGIGIVEGMAHLANDPEMSLNLLAYTSILNAKERAGQERAVGSAGFAAGKFSPQLHRRLIELMAEQTAFLHAFSRTAAPEAQKRLAEAQADPSHATVVEWRTIAMDSPFTGTLKDIQAPDWFKMETQRIDQLKGVENVTAGVLLQQVRDTLSRMQRQGAWMLVGLGSLVVVVGLFGAVIVIGVIPPLLASVAATKQLAAGYRSVEIPDQYLRDELGQLARATQFFKERLIQAEFEAAINGMDHELRIEAMTKKEKIVADFDVRMAQFVEEVGEYAQSLMGSAGTMTGVAKETTARSDMVSHAADETSQRVQSTAAATEQLAASIREIARQVQAQAGATQEAAEQARATNDQVESLMHSAARIGEVVQLIQNVASQTNLLALNATIEAARAGDAGKGFAVVANEVKSLASQTGKATEEIIQHVGEIQSATHEAVEAIRDITRQITEINGISTAVAAAVEEQEAATAEISRNVQETSVSTDQVSDNIRDVLHATQQAEDAAVVVSDAAQILGSHTEALRAEVRRFLEDVQS